ncbi:branched-chain amino acid ABC transporter substrate-binding protein [Ammoniphilus sp. YIM 78166]|uniref:branched-chain amino acid ABC transporter substrate-binding protein n=1 Tax=Ammoniphilus sp. YIM 78166 TaxID=1644106 RepID=UPI001070198E|nr:branched-chain amino acid ABC transporter substrate-binding protein [Ammoniphilus sp. YIM 78166]
MRKPSFLAASLVLSLGMLLSACGGGGSTPTGGSGDQSKPAEQPASSGSAVIKIATQSPLSGENAEMGEDIKLGAELALKDNAEKFKAMGFDLQLLPKDDKADPATGTTNAKALVTDQDVLALVGHLNSGVMAAAGTTYEGAGLPVVSPSNTNPQLSQNGWKTFHRICARDDNQGPAASQYIKDQGLNSVYVIDDATDYGKGLAIEMKKKAEELGLKVIAHESVSAQEMEFNTLVTKIKASNSEAVFFGGMYAQGGQFLKQLKDKQYTGMFLGGDGLDNGGFVTAAGAEASKLARITSVAGDITASAEGPAWVDRFKTSFKRDPGAFAGYGYDAALVVLNGLEQAIKDNGGKKPTREQVNAAISATKDFKGILSTTTFDDKGDNVNASVFIKSFEKGAYPPDQIAEIK